MIPAEGNTLLNIMINLCDAFSSVEIKDAEDTDYLLFYNFPSRRTKAFHISVTTSALRASPIPVALSLGSWGVEGQCVHP